MAGNAPYSLMKKMQKEIQEMKNWQERLFDYWYLQGKLGRSKRKDN